MKKLSSFLLVCLIMLYSSISFAASVDGTWVISLKGTLAYHEKLSGTKLSSEEYTMLEGLLKDRFSNASITIDTKNLLLTGSLNMDSEATPFIITKQNNDTTSIVLQDGSQLAIDLIIGSNNTLIFTSTNSPSTAMVFERK